MSDKPLRNFEKFEKGHYYVYTGEKTPNWADEMDAVLDHKIHKCTFSPFDGNTIARFDDVIMNWYDYINGFDDWVEVESPEAVFEIGDDCLRYNNIRKDWKISQVHQHFVSNNNKNGMESNYGVFYICKRKSNKKEETKKSKRYLCPHCKSDRTGLIGLHVKTEESTKCGNCLNLYSYDKESDSLVTVHFMEHSLIQRNALHGTPIKESLDTIQKEPMVLNFYSKMDKSWELSRALGEWVSFWTDKYKQLDKKENVFKKYIRTKKYMKFVKEKK